MRTNRVWPAMTVALSLGLAGCLEQSDLDAAVAELADGRVATLEGRVTSLEEGLADLATASSVEAINLAIAELTGRADALEALGDDLDGRVTSLETGLEGVGAAVDALGASLEAAIDAGDAALEAEFGALDTRVTSLEDQQVPVGTIIDWYRPSAATALPDGWEYADGSVVADGASPFNGATKPDLREKFTRGVSDMTTNADVGVSGGADSHSHWTDTTHSHTGYTSADGAHKHKAFYFDGYGQEWYSGNGEHLDWGGDWIGDYGGSSIDELAPLAVDNGASDDSFYTDTEPDHDHDVTTYPSGGWTNSDSQSNVPAYVGMVKLIRVH